MVDGPVVGWAVADPALVGKMAMAKETVDVSASVLPQAFDLPGVTVVKGEAVGGVIVMRHGENAPAVIEAVKARLEEIKPGLPPGVEMVTVYDRSDLIHRAIHELALEMLIVSLVILLFLWHIPSALIPILTLPVAVLLAFIPMRMLGVSANIMSLAGIAVAIGAMVDASVVVVENSHKKLELWARSRPAEGTAGTSGQAPKSYQEVLIKSIQEVEALA